MDADYLVAGSVSRLDEEFIIVVRLFSVRKGLVVPGSAIQQSCHNEEEIYPRTEAIALHLKDQILRRRTLRPPIPGPQDQLSRPLIIPPPN